MGNAPNWPVLDLLTKTKCQSNLEWIIKARFPLTLIQNNLVTEHLDVEFAVGNKFHQDAFAGLASRLDVQGAHPNNTARRGLSWWCIRDGPRTLTNAGVSQLTLFLFPLLQAAITSRAVGASRVGAVAEPPLGPAAGSVWGRTKNGFLLGRRRPFHHV